jgi:integrase
MASIWKHPKSRFWTACFTDGHGRRRRVTTKSTDRKIARKIADEFERASRNERTLQHFEERLRSFQEEFSGKPFARQSLAAFCKEWLEEKQPSVSVSTYKFYHKAVEKILTYFGERRAAEPINAVTRADLVGFRNALAKEVSSGTANHDLVAIKAIFRTARQTGCIAEDPAELIKPVRELRVGSPLSSRRPFAIPELQTLLATCDAEWRSMIKIGLYSGGRLGDIALLRWLNVDLERGELRFEARKTGKRVLIPLVGALRTHIEGLPSSDDSRAFLHPRAAASMERRNSSAGISQQFGELLELAGLRPLKERGGCGAGTRRSFSPLSFHSLRHTAVTLLKDAGIPQATVMELVGHSTVEMSALYTHVGRESLERAATALPLL